MSKCELCKHGIVQLANYKACKNKEISRLKFDSIAIEYGAKCFPCIHNGITGRKARLYKRVSSNWLVEHLIVSAFQSIDLFESDEHETEPKENRDKDEPCAEIEVKTY